MWERQLSILNKCSKTCWFRRSFVNIFTVLWFSTWLNLLNDLRFSKYIFQIKTLTSQKVTSYNVLVYSNYTERLWSLPLKKCFKENLVQNLLKTKQKNLQMRKYIDPIWIKWFYINKNSAIIKINENACMRLLFYILL